MKKFKEFYAVVREAAEGIEGYPPGLSDGSDKRRVDGNSFGGFRVGEGNTIERINAFISKYLQGEYLAGDYKLALRELRVRLNHIGLDFNSEQELIEGENRIKVKLHGNTFGTTPTTDLMKGFDTGEDLPTMTLNINYRHNPDNSMCYMSGKLSLDSLNEEQLNEFLPALAAAIPAVVSAARTIGTVATAAGAVKDLVSKKEQPVEGQMGEDGMKKRRIKHIKGILDKKKSELNEFAPLIPIIVGGARVLGPALVQAGVGYGISKLMGGNKSEESSSSTPTIELPKLPKEETPNTLAGQSSLGRFGHHRRGFVKSSRGRRINAIRTIIGARTTPKPNLREESETKSKDEPRVVEHFIMRNSDIKNKVLIPIYNNLKKLKEKKRYSKDVAAKHLYYVVNYAIRKLNSGGKKVTLSQLEKARVVNDLIRNFEKSVK